MLNKGDFIYFQDGKFSTSVRKTSQSLPTEAEIIDTYRAGKDLVYKVQLTLADGKVEFHELIMVGGSLVKFVKTDLVQQFGQWVSRTFKKIFGKK